jgi:hypothetical protein
MKVLSSLYIYIFQKIKCKRPAPSREEMFQKNILQFAHLINLE